MLVKITKVLSMASFLLITSSGGLFAGIIEMRIGPGYDSNVTRSVDDPEGDVYVNGRISWTRQADLEKPLDWTLTGAFDSTVYFGITEQDDISLSVSPGITYSPSGRFQINISPIVEASAVKDSDQSEISLGCGLYISQQLTPVIYAGEYASYTDSRAREDVYSQNELSLGAYLGFIIMKGFFAEAGYEYSYGTSYQTSTVSSGKGKGKHSSIFNYDVYQENVDVHQLNLNAEYDITDRVFVEIGYTFTYTKGDLGTNNSNDVMSGIGCRF